MKISENIMIYHHSIQYCVFDSRVHVRVCLWKLFFFSVIYIFGKANSIHSFICTHLNVEKMPNEIKRKHSKCSKYPFDLELCEKCEKPFQNGHLLKDQSSKSCSKKTKIVAELGNRFIKNNHQNQGQLWPKTDMLIDCILHKEIFAPVSFSLN